MLVIVLVEAFTIVYLIDSCISSCDFLSSEICVHTVGDRAEGSCIPFARNFVCGDATVEAVDTDCVDVVCVTEVVVGVTKDRVVCIVKECV